MATAPPTHRHAWLASIVGHAALVAWIAVAQCDRGPSRAPQRAAIPIEVVALPSATPTHVPAIARTPIRDDAAGGGGSSVSMPPAAHDGAARTQPATRAGRPTPKPRPPAPVTAPAPATTAPAPATTASAPATTASAPATTASTPATTTAASFASTRSPTTAGKDGRPAGSGGGRGGGIGRGLGTGLGDGTGGRGLRTAAVSAPRPVRRSLARPARLIWPTRTGDAEEGRLFVMLLTVDDEGFVVGVRLKQGSTSRQDEKAEDAVWRFRYDPARNDEGRPIASKVEQPFILRR